jgi:hypothetical protein
LGTRDPDAAKRSRSGARGISRVACNRLLGDSNANNDEISFIVMIQREAVAADKRAEPATPEQG